MVRQWLLLWGCTTSVSLHVVPGLRCPSVGTAQAIGPSIAGLRLPPVMVMAESQAADVEDDKFDAMIREEIEKAFEGLEESIARGDEDQAIDLIQSQGKEVLANVLSRMEEDGTLLSASLAERVERLAGDQTQALLGRYDAEAEAIAQEMDAARTSLRTEVDNLESLNRQYQELLGSKSSSGGFNKDSIVAGIAFLAGLAYGGAAVQDALKLALGLGGDPFQVVICGILGAGGIGYYVYRKQTSSS